MWQPALKRINSNEDWTVDLLVDQPEPAVPRGDHDDVDEEPVGQLVAGPEEQVQPGLGPVVANPGQPGSGQLGAGPEERVQPEQIRGQLEEVQPQLQELAPLLKPSPRKKAIKERWILKQ